MTLRLSFAGALLAVLSGAALPECASAFQPAPPQEPGNTIRVLLVVDAASPLAVDYRTEGRRWRSTLFGATMGILPIMIESKVASGERSRESKRLQETVGEFARRPVIESGIVAGFRAGSRYFDVVTPQDPASYGTAKAVDLKKALADGYPYVLVVSEAFAGMVTAWEMSTLSAATSLKWELNDSASQKRMAKGEAMYFAVDKYQLEPALSDRSIFLQGYPVAVAAAIGRIYGELNRQGHLHAMAAAHGLGKEVPATGPVLEKYAKLFDYNFKLPKDWHQVKGPTKYTLSLEPKNADRMKFGVSFSVDLLLEEFGQNVTSLDEYIGMAFARMKTAGYGVDEAQPFENLSFAPAHVAFWVDRPNRAGKEIVLFRKLEGPFVAMYSIVLLENHEAFLKKYGKDLESLINTAELKTRS